MFNKFNNLFVKEWFLIMKPSGLIDKIITYLRLLLHSCTLCITKLLPYKNRVIRNGYNLLHIKASDIIDRSNAIHVAGLKDENEVKHNLQYKYAVYNIRHEFDMIGCGFTQKIGLKGVDYIIFEGVYLFKQHPSVYSYTSIINDEIVYTTAIYSTAYQRLAGATYADVSASFPENYKHYHQMAKDLIVDNSYYTYSQLQGAYISKPLTGVIEKIEDFMGYKLCLTSTKCFIIAHKNSNYSLVLDKPVELKNPDYYIVKIRNKYYPVCYNSDNNIEQYKDLTSIYPSLTVTEGKFSGCELYEIIKKTGCNFINMPYINNIDSTLLKSRANNGLSVMFAGSIN